MLCEINFSAPPLRTMLPKDERCPCVSITRSITRCSAQNGLWTPTFFDFEHVQRGTLKKISEYGDFEHLIFWLWTCSQESTHCAHCAHKNLVEHTMLGNQLRINETVATWSHEIKIQLTLLITMSSHRLIWWRMAVLVTHNFFDTRFQASNFSRF
jgi:hypothetical protein